MEEVRNLIQGSFSEWEQVNQEKKLGTKKTKEKQK